ncbi:hypothetical protein JCM3770_007310 [Rhodotorula araucariae]
MLASLHSPPSPRILPLSPTPTSRSRPQAAPVACALDLHAWADTWALAAPRTVSRPFELHADPSSRSPAYGAAGSPGAFVRAHGDAARPQTPLKHSATRSKGPWVGTASLDGFKLDGTSATQGLCLGPHEDAQLSHRMRNNSLELDLGDLPKAAPFLLALQDQPYPSPVSPATTLFTSGSSSYFDFVPSAETLPSLAPSGCRDHLALPPSPALVPISLSRPASPARESSPPPRVEVAITHPLHRAKRLGMTPLASTAALPTSEPRTAVAGTEPPKVRKSSVVDLPQPQPASGFGGLPLSPPLTPALGFAELPSTMGSAGRSSSTKRQRQL